jgi:hypothetical protein
MSATARYHNVPLIAVPDNWLLEAEPDERDKTIQEFKRRLDALERTYPKIEISAWMQDREINGIEEQVSLFGPLPESTAAWFQPTTPLSRFKHTATCQSTLPRRTARKSTRWT